MYKVGWLILSDFTTYSKAIIISGMWFYHNNWQIDQWCRIEIHPNICGQLLFNKDVRIAYLGCHNRVAETRWLKKQNFFPSQFCRLEVLHQGAGWGGFWWSISFWPADGYLAVSSSGLYMVHVWSKRSPWYLYLFL